MDPLLASAGLASNGGPTQTIALQATSPAFDAMPTVSRPMRLLAPPYPHLPQPSTMDIRCEQPIGRTHLVGQYHAAILKRLGGSFSKAEGPLGPRLAYIITRICPVPLIPERRASQGG